MKNVPSSDPKPQCEGHPEGFPDVTTMPKGWDLSGLMTTHPSQPFDNTPSYSESSDRQASFDEGSQAPLPASLI